MNFDIIKLGNQYYLYCDTQLVAVFSTRKEAKDYIAYLVRRSAVIA